MKRILTAIAALLFTAGVVAAQNGWFANWPVVGSASYSCGSVNSVSNCTVPAGPTVLTGNEVIPASTNLGTGNTNPQSVLVGMNAIHALPISVVNMIIQPPAGISASNILGGILYTSNATMSLASITLPASPIDKQRFIIAANRNISVLSVSAGGTASIGGNTSPTALTPSATGPNNGYEFMYNATDNSWYRLQ